MHKQSKVFINIALICMTLLANMVFADLLTCINPYYSIRKDFHNRLQNEIGIEIEQQLIVNTFILGGAIGYARSISAYNDNSQRNLFEGPQFEDVYASLMFQFIIHKIDNYETILGIGGTGKWIRTRYYSLGYTKENPIGTHENMGSGGAFLRCGFKFEFGNIVISPFGKIFIDIGAIIYRSSSPIYPSIGTSVGINYKKKARIKN